VRYIESKWDARQDYSGKYRLIHDSGVEIRPRDKAWEIVGGPLNGSLYRTKRDAKQAFYSITVAEHYKSACVDCGGSVGTSVWMEELGMCVDCSHAYFSHSV